LKKGSFIVLACTSFGISQVSAGAHLHLFYAVGHAVTFAVNVALVEGQWQL